jgi:hypothetical protein
MTKRNSLRRAALLLLVLVAALCASSGAGPAAQALGACEDQCQRQYDECRRLGIDYYTCSQQRNYCLYHCQSARSR